MRSHLATSTRTLRYAAALTVVAALALSGCTSTPGQSAAPTTGSSGAGATDGAAATPAATPDVELVPNVTEGTPVTVDTVVSVAAKGGTVTSVAMSYKDAKAATVQVEGSLAPDGSSWTARSLLEPGTVYALQMTGVNADGKQTTKDSTFTTQKLSKKQEIFPTLTADGATVGVAMPVIVRFDVPVTDKAAFEKKLTVTSVPAQNGSWAWYGSSEVHWRPEKYWQPGTKVSVNVDINGVAAGNGTYGQKSITGGFTVGSSTILKADLASHQMTVLVDGQAARTIPITGGKPGWVTRSGTKVIMEKFAEVKMDATTVGLDKSDPEYYSIPDVKYALRETWSGEFLHAAPWSVGSQGRANVSHGCIGMSTGNAQWLFNQVKVGDPVVVSGTNRGLERGNGWTDWNISFEEFKSFSALAPGKASATSTAKPTAAATSTAKATATS
ncbi:MAG TPA: Ig-like domain-containing protein [Dermatophilaceae bacterium]|nr:Ig-like domain-containing protein [Dermatophilaceae bacterium]HMT88439.1 Ig-like domain-containing protein [Dermatophilaceae bacterium]